MRRGVLGKKGGAGGAIGGADRRGEPADGQTIRVTASNVLTEIPHVLKMPYDTLADVKPVATVARALLVLVAAPDVPAKDLNGLVAHVKAHPGKVSFASYSAGTISHYAGMILNQKAGLDMQHVPFAGSPPALQQVMGGQIQVMFDGIVTSMPLIRSGKLKALGIASGSRSAHLPDVPTMAELGLPELDFSNWLGVVVASGVSADVTARINAAVLKAAAAPEIVTRMAVVVFELNLNASAADLARSVWSDFEKNGAPVKRFGIKLDC